HHKPAWFSDTKPSTRRRSHAAPGPEDRRGKGCHVPARNGRAHRVADRDDLAHEPARHCRLSGAYFRDSITGACSETRWRGRGIEWRPIRAAQMVILVQRARFGYVGSIGPIRLLASTLLV